MPSPWKVLGLKEGASQNEIRRAYYRIAKETHPDRVPGREADFRQAHEAYEVLTGKTCTVPSYEDLEMWMISMLAILERLNSNFDRLNTELDEQRECISALSVRVDALEERMVNTENRITQFFEEQRLYREEYVARVIAQRQWRRQRLRKLRAHRRRLKRSRVHKHRY